MTDLQPSYLQKIDGTNAREALNNYRDKSAIVELADKLIKTGAAISYARDRQREPYSLPFTPSAAESVAAVPSTTQ